MKKSLKTLLSLAISAIMVASSLPMAIAAETSATIVKDNMNWLDWYIPEECTWKSFLEGSIYNVGSVSYWNNFEKYPWRPTKTDAKQVIADASVGGDTGINYKLYSERGNASSEVVSIGRTNAGKEWGYLGHSYVGLGDLKDKSVIPDEVWMGVKDISAYEDNGYAVFTVSGAQYVENAYLCIMGPGDNWQFEGFLPNQENMWPITRETHADKKWGFGTVAINGVKLTDYVNMSAGWPQKVAVPLSKLVNDPDFQEFGGKSISGIEKYYNKESYKFDLSLFSGMGVAKQDAGKGETMTVRFTDLEIVALPIPQNLVASANGETVNLSWNAVAEKDVTYSVARTVAGETEYVATGLTTPSYTDTVSGSGTYTYTVETYSSDYGVSSPASEAVTAEVVVEGDESADASELIVESIDTTSSGEEKENNIFVGDYYIGSTWDEPIQFNMDYSTNSLYEGGVKVGKIFRIHDTDYTGTEYVNRKITKRPTAPGQYTITRTSSSGKVYTADGYIERYVGDNWGYGGYVYNDTVTNHLKDLSAAEDGYAIYTLEITEGSCLEDAYLALTYIDMDDSWVRSSGEHRGAIVAGVPLEKYYDVTKLGKQTVVVPLSEFEFSENEDAFLGVATNSGRSTYAYFADRAAWRAANKIQLNGFTGMGVARDDTNLDSVDSFEVSISGLAIAKAPENAPVLTVATNENDNTLSWTASGYSDTTYTITKSNGTTSQTINAGIALSYVDADVEDGDYTYTVTAKIGEYDIPSESNSVSVKVGNAQPEEPEVPEVPDEPVDSNYTVVEDIDWENWQVAGTETNLLADRSLYVSREGGEDGFTSDGFWNDYQGYWVVENQDYLDIEINDTGYSADFEGDIATLTNVKDASGNKAMQTVPTSDGNLWGYKGTKYFLGAYADIPSNWSKDRWFGIKDVSAYENTGYFAFDVEVSEGADIDNAYLAIEVATKASEVANGGITLPVTDEQIASNTNKWETKTTFVVGVPMADYYDTTAMGRQKVYVPISEFVNNAAMREMYSKSTSRSVNDFANNLANCPTDLRLFMGMGIAKKNSADYEANPKAFNAKVYDLTVEVPNVKEPKITVTSVDMGSYAGKAWDVEIEDFDGAKSYTAKFVDGSDVKTGEIGFENVEADGGSVAFAIFLHTSRAAVALDVVAE